MCVCACSKPVRQTGRGRQIIVMDAPAVPQIWCEEESRGEKKNPAILNGWCFPETGMSERTNGAKYTYTHTHTHSPNTNWITTPGQEWGQSQKETPDSWVITEWVFRRQAYAYAHTHTYKHSFTCSHIHTLVHLDMMSSPLLQNKKHKGKIKPLVLAALTRLKASYS